VRAGRDGGVADLVGGTQEQDEEVLNDEAVRYLVSRLLAVVADFPRVPLPAKGGGHHVLNCCEGLVRFGLEAIGATPAHAGLILAIASVAAFDGPRRLVGFEARRCGDKINGVPMADPPNSF
jgi:hypothetical protein